MPPPIGKIRYTIIHKAGQTHSVPAERDFYIRYMMDSKFHSRIATLADQTQMLIKEKGGSVKFDRERFYEAAGVAIYAHRNQVRKVSGEHYAVHPIELVEAEVRVLRVTDQEELIGLLLHDVIEDTEFNYNFIQRRFGKVTANLIDGMTKIEQLGADRLINEKNINKFVQALAQDIRLLRMKMTDRALNLVDAPQQKAESRERNAREALDFYIPLGVLAGFMKASRHLSDVAFKALDPERHHEIATAIESTMTENRQLLSLMILKIAKEYRKKLSSLVPRDYFGGNELRRFLAAKNIDILTKPRTVYEVDQISAMRGTDARHLSDIVMMQVTVDTVNDCYTMAEVIHSLGVPIDRYWHDYVKDPKINGYQSLHTGILVDGKLIRFQIRTNKMQRVAQEGVLYEAFTPSGKFRQPKLPWLTEDWLKIILQSGDRREKILLTKSLAQARQANVLVIGDSMRASYQYEDVLLPRGISPLEIAFITDPTLGVHLIEAFHHDVRKPIEAPIEEGIGFIKLQVADDMQYVDYTKLLKNPLARLRFKEHLEKQGEASRNQFAARILEKHLAEIYLSINELEGLGSTTLSELTSSLIDQGWPAEKIVDGVRQVAKHSDECLIAIERLELEPGEKLPDHLIDNMRRVFPIERLGFIGSKLQLSLPIWSEMQRVQFDRYFSLLEREAAVKVAMHETIKLPIIDEVLLNPHSLFYSHAVAKRAADALERQGGNVLDMSLNPPLVDMLRTQARDTLWASQQLQALQEIYAEHIAEAGILFFSGYPQDVEHFRTVLRKIIDPQTDDAPLVVVFDRQGMFDIEAIVNPLARMRNIGSGISAMGYRSDFLLWCLNQRMGKQNYSSFADFARKFSF